VDEEKRVRKAQSLVEQAAVTLGAERARIDTASGLVDDEVPDAMVDGEMRPTLTFVLHGRLETALEEFDELLETLADAATLDGHTVEERWRARKDPPGDVW